METIITDIKWKKKKSHTWNSSSSLFYALDVVLNYARHNVIVLLDHFLHKKIKKEKKKKKERVMTGQKCTDDLVISWGKIAVILQNCKFSEIMLGLIVAAFIIAEPHIPGGTT